MVYAVLLLRRVIVGMRIFSKQFPSFCVISYYVSKTEEIPPSIRAPDEDVVDLARACLPFVEMGLVGFIAVPSVKLTVKSFLRLSF